MNTTISIPKTTKDRAQKVAKKYDMTVSAVARMLLNDFASGRIQITTVIPAVNIPNTETIQAMKDIENGDVYEAKNAEDLFEQLGI